ncbi:hypothetical protein K4098_001668 [Escherichia coli]|nr:hypothetical protein [Escherichia coli]EJB4119999.1 hypothetical protein [Escherichia coli]
MSDYHHGVQVLEINDGNLGGDFKEFQSAYEAVGTDLFDQQEGALRKLTHPEPLP